jgi:hypothetical protein
MRVVMPLFQFQYYGLDEFVFSDGQLALRNFNHAHHDINLPIFSERDRDYIKLEKHALVAESDCLNEQEYRQNVNLLLTAFRILGDDLTPFIKYRLSENHDFCSRLDETETNILLPEYLFQVYSVADFPRIDKAYMMLRDAEKISIRLKNALFFLYKAFYSVHWIDAFLFHMNALEALFSLDEKRSATKAITSRTSRLLSDPTNWDEGTIGDLYNTRSAIAHGRIEANPDPKDNLHLAEKMERVTKLCFRKLIDLDAFRHFATPASRDTFLGPV